MPNALTGDFEAVLQVSGRTINRLLATMHQNGFARPDLPSFPHSVRMRIGDDHAIDGVRGRVHAQVGAPAVTLIHRATDRFVLEVPVRAWYRPDPGTEPLPMFMHGTVRAEYRVEDIDPSCFGWAGIASEYLWVRVVQHSVAFDGTAEEERAPFELSPIAAGAGGAAAATASIAKITKQVAGLLATRFQATPHPVSRRFRRGSLRSLNPPSGGSAVALPIGLTGEPAGQVTSIENVVLNGSDVAFAVSVGHIMSLVQPAVDAVKAFHNTSIPVHVNTDWPQPDFDTVYRVHLNAPVVEWQPQGSHAAINVKVHGSAHTDSVAADATFDVDASVRLAFDPGARRLSLTAGPLKVTASASGLYHGTVADEVSDGVSATVKVIVDAVCAQAELRLESMTTQLQPLVDQLRTLDAAADLRLTAGVFLPDGIIVRGRIPLAGRSAPVVRLEKTAEQDGHTALESWIPGGRIDTFEWSWSWFATRPGGKATYADRFLLRRPRGKVSRWGMALGLSLPLPGIDGWGVVCLRIKGMQVDPVTGALVPVQSVKRCIRFGFNFTDRVGGGRLLLRDVPELAQDVPFPQLSLVRAGVHAPGGATNTLMLYLDEAWDEETASVLSQGLAACGRYDAGLALVVLFRERLLEAAGARAIREIERFAEHVGVAAIVNEDVAGAWSRAFGLRAGSGQPAWCLVSPDGAVTWTHNGRGTPELLTSALDTHLHRSPKPVPVPANAALAAGARVTAAALRPGVLELIASRCPPPPVGRFGVKRSVVTFVHKDSGASEAHLRALFDQYGQRGDEGPVVVAVVDGAGAREAEALKHRLGIDFITVPDPTGSITDRFGIATWPTTLTLDRGGTVEAIEVGVGQARANPA